MIFLSAQPDTQYLKWQLEIFLFNIKKFKIPKEQIHILVAYNPKKGVSEIYRNNLSEIFDHATLYFYPDVRSKRNYISSIRPHIIKKHFEVFPELENEVIFYHDADIIFRALPNFEKLIEGPKWYVADTLAYTSADAIKKAGKIVLEEMAEIVNMPIEIIEKNNFSSGGAQYLLKGVCYEFWDKVEFDCERLYTHLSVNKERYSEIFQKESGLDKSEYKGVIQWCADMWALIWAAFKNNIDISISDELAFCWPTDPLDQWESVNIFHNAGLEHTDSWQYFFKGDFVHSTPFNSSLDYVRKDKCTYKYVQEIREYLKHTRYDMADVTFLIPVRIDSEDRLRNLYIITAFIDKYIDTNFIVLEADNYQKVDVKMLPQHTDYLFIEDFDQNFHRTKYNNLMIKRAITEVIVLQDTDVIIDPLQFNLALSYIRNNDAKIVIPYDGCFRMVYDLNQIEYFSFKLDIEILRRRETSIVREKSCGGAVMIHREEYIKCGMENERFYRWGPEDIERIRRMEILGHKAKWIDSGHLYHLRHEIHQNSGYSSRKEYGDLMQIQLDILALSKDELKNKINQWH